MSHQDSVRKGEPGHPAHITLWHGARRWEGQPELRAPKAGRYEAGPGIYLTNRYLRGRKYSQGGTLMLMTVDPNLTFVEDVSRPLPLIIDFLHSVPRMRNRERVIEDLKRSAARLHAGRGDSIAEDTPLNYLVNLCVNHDAILGQPGLHLAQWLVSQGVDASIHPVGAQEDWLVIFNPGKIIGWKRMRSADVDALGNLDWPRCVDQLAALRATRATKNESPPVGRPAAKP